ncbi:carboxypeptidase-like regulatory domain-containing protein [Terriglobus tenax]|uniref:carboxypeptidase-like regulatory domain-containing protein n=1 Tax=Terriglobus tenax TaxID=1111115 RepID=UPI0021DFB477|nr:carboxypeptidase-like regulatory domain-containing protein [Terriglobus tenax]
MTSTNFLRLSASLLLAVPVFAVAQGTITGTVINKTTGKPAAGDEITLIRLQQGMQESTKTKTDAKGNFTLQVPDPGIHLVRATHDKTPYFRPAPPGTESVELEVYDAAPKVSGITWEADVMRLQTDESGKRLRVVENFFVKNESSPAKTQFSDRPFDFWLPTDATISGSAALGPGGMPVQSSPMPLEEKGHYAFVFPIRPGETRFQVSYEVPYNGSVTLSPRPTMKTGTIALMMPKSFEFEATGAPYNQVEELNAQTYVARDIAPGAKLGFTVSGTGQLPRDTAQTGADGQPTAGPAAGGEQPAMGGGSAATDTKPGGGLGTPIDTPDPLTKYKWWILSGLALLLAIAAGFFLSGKPNQTPVAAAPATPSAPPLLQTLKDELFALETDRATGKLSEADYLEQKAALETVLKRALNRS